MSSSIKTLIIMVLAGASAAGAGYSCSGCGASNQEVIVRQGPPAVACLPVFLPQIIADAQAHNAAQAIVHTAQLVECWVAHEPAPAPAPAAGSSGSGSAS